MRSSTISQNHPKAKIIYALLGATAYFIMYVYVLLILKRTRHQREITAGDQRRFAVLTWFSYLMLFFSLLPSLYVAGVPQAIYGFMTTRFPGLNQRIASVGSSIITWLVTGVLSGVAYDIIKKLSIRLIRGAAKGSK
jgi:4-amino-4-deoxy-L-arabinose transferase-like glycosyltransferase